MRVKAVRLQSGHSQKYLASQVGVTFQQIQKYESGANRIGSGRLFEIATVLGVDVSTFFKGADSEGRQPPQEVLDFGNLSRTDHEIMKILTMIDNPKFKLAVRNMLVSLSADIDPDLPPE